MENIYKFKNWKLFNHLCEIRVDGIEPQIDIFWRFPAGESEISYLSKVEYNLPRDLCPNLQSK